MPLCRLVPALILVNEPLLSSTVPQRYTVISYVTLNDGRHLDVLANIEMAFPTDK
jgi:hypothetical protein